jgi:hypothetical protein
MTKQRIAQARYTNGQCFLGCVAFLFDTRMQLGVSTDGQATSASFQPLCIF